MFRYVQLAGFSRGHGHFSVGHFCVELAYTVHKIPMYTCATSLMNPKQPWQFVSLFARPVVLNFKHPIHYTVIIAPILLPTTTHRTQELISALDLHTVPWSQVPRRLKQRLSLPLEDRGIDSLALNLTVAVQAKDYSNSVVPLNRFLVYVHAGSFCNLLLCKFR